MSVSYTIQLCRQPKVSLKGDTVVNFVCGRVNRIISDLLRYSIVALSEIFPLTIAKVTTISNFISSDDDE